MTTSSVISLLISLSCLFSGCKPTQTVPRPLPNGEKPAGDHSPLSINISDGKAAKTPKGSLSSASSDADPAASEPLAPEKHLVRIDSTTQSYSAAMPWNKNSPSSNAGLGVVIEAPNAEGQLQRYILTSGSLVANATFISFAKNDNGKSYKARVKAVDHDLDLALLLPDGEDSQNGINEFLVTPLGDKTALSQKLEGWQLATEGYPIVTEATIQGFTIFSPSENRQGYLSFNAKAPIQNSVVTDGMPLIDKGKLVGKYLNHDSNSQIVEAVDISVIKSFLNDALSNGYEGAPDLGLSIKETTDPAFRKYLKLPEDERGVYINSVHKKGCAARAGVQKGDVLVAINDKPISHRGYTSSPYGELQWDYLLQGQKVGDTVTLSLIRDGSPLNLSVVLDNAAAKSNIVPESLYDKAPPYIIHGGVVFIELSLPYLRSFGSNWESRSPVELAAAAKDPSSYEDKGLESIVVIPGIISTPATHGYTSIQGVILKNFNGQAVKSLKHLGELINNAPEGIQSLEFNRPPYTIYLDKKLVESSNDMLKKRVIPKLQRLDSTP